MKTIVFLFIAFLAIPVLGQKTGETKPTNQTTQPSKNSPNRVVFMGDSITDFWSKAEYGGFFPGKSYINRGISGQSTSHMLERFQKDVIDLKPKAVVILAGTNDIYGGVPLEQTGANIDSMAKRAKANGIKVIISSVLPVSDSVRGKNGAFLINSDSRPLNKISAMNKWLKNYAQQNGHIYLDYYGAMADRSGFLKNGTSDDGLHPNANGYKIMAPLVEKAITQALKNKK